MKQFFPPAAPCQHTFFRTLFKVSLSRFSAKRLLLLACFLGLAFSGHSQYQREWVKEFAQTPPPQLAKTDHNQNLLTLGDNQLSKSGPDGTLLWQQSFVGDDAKFALDMAGNAYILTGYTPGGDNMSSAKEQVLVTKFTADGQIAWEYSYTPQDAKIWGEGIDVNQHGEVYFITTLIDSRSHTFVQTIKLDAAGTLAWQRDYNGFDEMNPVAHAIEVTSEGDAYIAGVDNIAEWGSRPFLLKYSGTDGSTLVEKNYAAELTHFDAYRYRIQQILIDENKDVYLTGLRFSSLRPVFFNIVIKTNAAGEILWHEDIFNRRTNLLSSVMDESGNIILLSYHQTDEFITVYEVTKVNSDGQTAWSHTLDNSEATGLGSVRGVAPVATLPGGRVAVAGSTTGDDGEEIFALVLGTDGEVVWSDRYNHAGITSEGTRALAVDASGNLYIAGFTQFPGTEGATALLLKYAAGTDEKTVQVHLFLPPYAMKVGEDVLTTADFGDFTQLEGAGVRWDWGDGHTSAAYTLPDNPRVTGQHRYEEAGIYKVGLDFGESNLQPASDAYKQWMVIFDPKAGAVLGGGLMHSPRTNLDLMQEDMRAAFTFLLDYKQQQPDAKPSGALVLAFENKDIFWSTSEEWLVVKYDRAVWHGTGKLNGKGRYGYIASAIDGGGSGLNDTGDHLRIQIWDMENGNRMVYDNSHLDTDIKDMGQALPPIYAGQIIIGNKNIPANLFAFNPRSVLTDMMQVEVFPTRFQDKATLNFTLVDGGAYTVSIHDLNGRLVQQVKQGHAVPLQQNTLTIDGTGMKGGIYIARVVSGEGAKTVRVVVTR